MFMNGMYKLRGNGNGFFGYRNDNLDGLSKLNRGPRSKYFKNYNEHLPTVKKEAKEQSLPTSENVEDPSPVPDKEQYNKTNFSDKYFEATFFVIKSYNEDDIHKSIKYNVWASTPNGNKKLDAAYKEVRYKVNTSGQFVGVVEMVGPVDFDKIVDLWKQDKWNGCFNVKWNIVKYVPNNILRHIIVEDKDNKPVTNSRDTQEVKLEQGLQMLKIFKEHTSKTSESGVFEQRAEHVCLRS